MTISMHTIEKIDAIKEDIIKAKQKIKIDKILLLICQIITIIAGVSMLITISYSTSTVDKILLTVVGSISLVFLLLGGVFWGEQHRIISDLKRRISTKQKEIRRLLQQDKAL